MAGPYRSWLVALTVAVGTFFTVATGACAAVGGVSSGGMIVTAGSQQVTLVSRRPMLDGRLQTEWTTSAGADVTVTAPPGSTVTIGQNTAEVSPPLSRVGAATASNPCDHCRYNPLTLTHCAETCTHGASDQYALQEVPGEWFMGQHITGTVYSGSGVPVEDEAYNTFPDERGDSGPLNYKPAGDQCPSSGTTWNWSFSGWGLTFGESGPLSDGSCYGPIAPSGWDHPAFGSKWWARSVQSGDHAIGSFDAIHLGPGQSPYDTLQVRSA